MEAGKRNVTALELRRLARLYRRDVAWILGEGSETLEATTVDNQALFRATAHLSDEDKEQVLRFAQFLAAGQLSAAAPAVAASRWSRRTQASHRSEPDAGGEVTPTQSDAEV
jgi:hypothetical protein